MTGYAGNEREGRRNLEENRLAGLLAFAALKGFKLLLLCKKAGECL